MMISNSVQTRIDIVGGIELTSKFRSKKAVCGLDRAPARALYRATGLNDLDFEKPMIEIANSWNEIIPGHVHLNRLAKEVSDGIREAGGVPLSFGIPAFATASQWGTRA